MTGPARPPAMERHVPLRAERDIALARAAAGQLCDALGSGALRKTRFVTAVSEIARNAVDHGGGGMLVLQGDARRRAIFARCVDDGPGIAEIERALGDGYSTAGSMGKGLGGARRLVDRFELGNRPEGGLWVELRSSL